MHDDERYVFDALKAGASGYVLKREVDQALLNAIRAVHRGDAFLTNAVERSLIRDWMSDDAEGPDEPLSPREQEVLKLIAEAHTNKQIAEILHLAEKTGRVAPRQPAAQARHARPRRARALRDPPRAHRGAGQLRLGGVPAAARLRPARRSTLCAAAAVVGVVPRRRAATTRPRVADRPDGLGRLRPPAGRDGARLPRCATRTASRVDDGASTAAGPSR